MSRVVDARAPLARVTFAATALAVLVGLLVQVSVSANLKGTQFHSTGALIFNVFCYFTVQSNIIVGVTTGLLALRPSRSATTFSVFRLCGLIAIAITGVVFHVALKRLQDLHGAAAVADTLLHTVVPVLAVVGWLLFGPRRLVSWRVARLAVLFPICWVAFALVRGALIDFYPYPFIDVRVLGYLRVLGNVVLVGLLFFALAALAIAADRRLAQAGGDSPTP